MPGLRRSQPGRTGPGCQPLGPAWAQQSSTSRSSSAPGVSAAEVAQTNVIAITAVAAVPAQAARVADAYAGAFVSYQRTVALNSLAAAEGQLGLRSGRSTPRSSS